jgi:hypothetical protein
MDGIETGKEDCSIEELGHAIAASIKAVDKEWPEESDTAIRAPDGS